MNWNERERYILSKLGLRRQPLSGGGDLFKEDGESERLIVQLKSTEGKGLTVTRQVWKEVAAHAVTSHKTPMLVLDFVGGPTLLCILPEHLDEIYTHFQGDVQEVKVVERPPSGSLDDQIEQLL